MVWEGEGVVKVCRDWSERSGHLLRSSCVVYWTLEGFPSGSRGRIRNSRVVRLPSEVTTGGLWTRISSFTISYNWFTGHRQWRDPGTIVLSVCSSEYRSHLPLLPPPSRGRTTFVSGWSPSYDSTRPQDVRTTYKSPDTGEPIEDGYVCRWTLPLRLPRHLCRHSPLSSPSFYRFRMTPTTSLGDDPSGTWRPTPPGCRRRTTRAMAGTHRSTLGDRRR